MKKRILIIAAALILILCAAKPVGNLIADVSAATAGSMDKNGDGIIHILLTGADNDNLTGIDAQGDADGTCLITINEKDRRIVFTSVLRDTQFGRASNWYEKTKLTLMYHYYGYEEYRKSLETGLGFTIDNYILFDYLDLIEIIDAIGGVDVETYDEETGYINYKIRELNKKLLMLDEEDGVLNQWGGLLHLDGKQAVAYMRVRIDDDSRNDFGRTDRGRKVMLAMKNKLLTMNRTEQLAILQKCLGIVRDTDISFSDAVAYARKLAAYKNYEIVQCRLPREDLYYSDGSVIYMDFDANVAYWQSIINGTYTD